MLSLAILIPLSFLGAAPLDVADHKQLFIDDRFIADSDRVELHTNPGAKAGARSSTSTASRSRATSAA